MRFLQVPTLGVPRLPLFYSKPPIRVIKPKFPITGSVQAALKSLVVADSSDIGSFAKYSHRDECRKFFPDGRRGLGYWLVTVDPTARSNHITPVPTRASPLRIYTLPMPSLTSRKCPPHFLDDHLDPHLANLE